MSRYLYTAVIVASVFATDIIDSLDAREPPESFRPKLSTVVELDLTTGISRTISEHKENTLTLLDQRDGVLLGVEFDGKEKPQMFGLSPTTGKVLWAFGTDSETWEHFFDYRFNEPEGFSIPHHDFAKPPTGGRTPFCGLAGDTLAGIDVHTGRVLWRITPPGHASNDFAWQSVFQLRDQVVAVIHGRVMIVSRTDGQIMLELKRAPTASYYKVDQPVETDDYILMAFDNGKDKELIRWNKQSAKVDERYNSGRTVVKVMAATKGLVITHEQGSFVGRNIQRLDQVIWRKKREAWFDPGARAVVWGQYLVTRSEDMPTTDLRDGSEFSLFHQPKGRVVRFSNYPWAIQDETLYTVSPSGIQCWNKNRLESRGSPTLEKPIWTPSTESTDSKREPAFIDCLMGSGKIYLVLVHDWNPVF